MPTCNDLISSSGTQGRGGRCLYIQLVRRNQLDVASTLLNTEACIGMWYSGCAQVAFIPLLAYVVPYSRKSGPYMAEVRVLRVCRHVSLENCPPLGDS